MKFGLLFGLITCFQFAYAIPNNETTAALRPFGYSSTSISAYDFEGTVALSNCSGSIVRYEKSQDDDLALVLTNGHCLGTYLEPDETVYRKPIKRSFQVLGRNAERRGIVHADQIVYATMTKTDLALYRLTKTYKQIQTDFGVRALMIESQPSTPVIGIEVISGYWSEGFTCDYEAEVHILKEDKWTFENSLRYSPECVIKGGTSGSPVIDRLKRTVVGVNNTQNEGGRDCTLNNPCEVDPSGNKTVLRNRGYGQQTWWIYTCLDENLQVDPNLEGCLLP